MRDVIVWVAGVCLLALVAPLANAELVTINIEGVVDEVYDDYNYLNGQVNPGDIITGWYTYDTNTQDSVPEFTTVGRYEHFSPPAGIYLTVEGLEFKTDPLNTNFLVGISNDVTSGGLHDSYWIDSYNNLYDGMPVGEMMWALRDYSAQALSSTELVSTAPDLSLWEENWLAFGAGTKLESFSIVGHVTNAIVVPEPCMLVLFGIGALAVLRRIS